MRSFLVLLLSLITYSSFGQVNFQSLDYVQALQKARQENKLLLVQIDNKECVQCNEIALIGLSSRAVKLLTDEKFIAIKSTSVPESIYNDNSFYQFSPNFFGLLIVCKQGSLLDIMNYSTTRRQDYEDFLVNGIEDNKNRKSPTLSEMASAYERNPGNFDTVYTFVKKIRGIELDPTQATLDQLTDLAPGDSADSKSFLALVIQCAPLIYSRAYNYLTHNTKIFSGMWSQFSTKTKDQINARVTTKSLQKAVAEKDENYASKISEWIQKVHPKTVFGQRESKRILLGYYKGVKDSVHYTELAKIYYNTYFMSNKLLDSIKRNDQKRLEEVKNRARKNAMNGFPKPTESFSYVEDAQYYSRQLNDGAWYLYVYSKNKEDLQLAQQWAQRAIDFFKTPDAVDTYARLLYVNGENKKAIEWEAKAVTLSANKQRVQSRKQFAEVLQKMKAGASIADL